MPVTRDLEGAPETEEEVFEFDNPYEIKGGVEKMFKAANVKKPRTKFFTNPFLRKGEEGDYFASPEEAEENVKKLLDSLPSKTEILRAERSNLKAQNELLKAKKAEYRIALKALQREQANSLNMLVQFTNMNNRALSKRTRQTEKTAKYIMRLNSQTYNAACQSSREIRQYMSRLALEHENIQRMANARQKSQYERQVLAIQKKEARLGLPVNEGYRVDPGEIVDIFNGGMNKAGASVPENALIPDMGEIIIDTHPIRNDQSTSRRRGIFG